MIEGSHNIGKMYKCSDEKLEDIIRKTFSDTFEKEMKETVRKFKLFVFCNNEEQLYNWLTMFDTAMKKEIKEQYGDKFGF